MWELDSEESWAPKNWCFWTVVLEKTLESPLDCKEIQPVHSKGDQSGVFFGRNDAKAEAPNTLATSSGELTHWKRFWCWEGLGAGGEGDDRGWDGWMASPTQWMWVWVNSGSWWWTGRPGVLWFMGSRRVRHDWATEWTDRHWTRWPLSPWVIRKKTKNQPNNNEHFEHPDGSLNLFITKENQAPWWNGYSASEARNKLILEHLTYQIEMKLSKTTRFGSEGLGS